MGTGADINLAISDLMTRDVFRHGFWQRYRKSSVFAHTGGLGYHAYELLNSEGFIWALKVCYKGDEDKERRYVLDLILVDAVIKAAYLRATVDSLRWSWKLIKWLAGSTLGRYALGGVSVAVATQRQKLFPSKDPGIQDVLTQTTKRTHFVLRTTSA